MRCVSLLLLVLLVACSQQPTEDLAAALAADPVRLKALREQCAADRTAAGERLPGRGRRFPAALFRR